MKGKGGVARADVDNDDSFKEMPIVFKIGRTCKRKEDESTLLAWLRLGKRSSWAV